MRFTILQRTGFVVVLAFAAFSRNNRRIVGSGSVPGSNRRRVIVLASVWNPRRSTTNTFAHGRGVFSFQGGRPTYATSCLQDMQNTDDDTGSHMSSDATGSEDLFLAIAMSLDDSVPVDGTVDRLEDSPDLFDTTQVGVHHRRCHPRMT